MPHLRRHVRAQPPDERVVRAVHMPAGPRRHGEAAVGSVGRRDRDPPSRLARARRPGRRRLLRWCLRLPLTCDEPLAHRDMATGRRRGGLAGRANARRRAARLRVRPARARRGAQPAGCAPSCCHRRHRRPALDRRFTAGDAAAVADRGGRFCRHPGGAHRAAKNLPGGWLAHPQLGRTGHGQAHREGGLPGRRGARGTPPDRPLQQEVPLQPALGAPRVGRRATAIGPGAALALARPADQRSIAPRYVPDAVGVSRSELARCPLTVVDLGAVPAARGRAAAVRADDRRLGQIAAAIPRGGLLVVAAPADAATPHLRVVVVSGPGYLAGLLRTASTRQPGLVQLTDLTAAVLTWRHQRLPGDLVGSALQRQARGGRLAAAVGGLVGQDTAAQVHRSTAGWFFAAYAVGDGVLFGAITLFCWGAARRKRRHRWLRIAGAFTGAVVPASFLASLVPWWRLAHPAGTLYVLTAASAAVIGAAALAGPWRRDPFGPVGVVSVITVAVIGLDVMTGSRLQIGTPFGLSTLEAGRFYGVGNNALVPYGAAGILAGAWLALVAAARAAPARGGDPLGGRDRPQRPAALARGDGPRPPGDDPPSRGDDPPSRGGDPPARGGDPPAPPARAGAARRDATLAVAGVAAFAVIASGWPGFGSKFGGTVAMVPGFVLLGLHAAGVRVTLRRAARIAVSGLAAVVVFALVNYFVPLTGQSHIGEFVGQVLHGGAGVVLQRKINSNVGSLTITPYSPLVPVVVIALGLLLARPRWFGAWWLPRSWAAAPMLRATM